MLKKLGAGLHARFLAFFCQSGGWNRVKASLFRAVNSRAPFGHGLWSAVHSPQQLGAKPSRTRPCKVFDSVLLFFFVAAY